MCGYSSFAEFLRSANASRLWTIVAGVALSVPETKRRVNRAFETYSDELAARLQDLSIPWVDGSISRFGLLCRGLGLFPTWRVLRQNAASDKCGAWNGAERRIARKGLSLLIAESNKLRRRADSTEFVSHLLKRTRMICN